MVRYEWDEPKNLANSVKHGVSFEAIHEFRWDTALELTDTRKDYGESRWVVMGRIGARLHILIHTVRSGAIRVISLRKANPREEIAYERQKK